MPEPLKQPGGYCLERMRGFMSLCLRRACGCLLLSALLILAGCNGTKAARESRMAGIGLLEQEDYGYAIERFQMALDKAGPFSREFQTDVRKYLAEAQYRSGDYAAAADTWAVLLEEDGEKPEYQYFRAASLAMSGNLPEAEELFTRAMKKSGSDGYETPGAQPALAAVISAMIGDGRLEDALELSVSLLEAGWTVPEVDNQAGICQAELGDYDAAEQYYYDGLAAAKAEDGSMLPIAGQIRRNMGVLEERRGNYTYALDIFRECEADYGGDEALTREIHFLESRIKDY